MASNWRVGGIGAILCIALPVIVGCETPAPQPTSAPTSRPAAQPIEQTEEKGPLKVTVTVDKDRILAGDSITLSVRIEAEAGVEVGVPKFEGIVGEFEVTDTRESKPDCEPYKNCAQWDYALTCVVPGEATIPALPFSFKDPREKADGSNTLYQDELETKPIEIHVDENLADMKGPMSLPIPFEYRLLWWTVGVIATVVLIGLIARLIARRAATTATATAEPVIPPDEWALRELELLMAEKLIERGRVQEYFYRLNALLRRYVELRFGQMASEQTSEEFIESLQDSLFLSESHKSTLRRFTASCDPVKYARHIPTQEEIEWVGTSAKAFIVETAKAGPPMSATPAGESSSQLQESGV